MSREPRGFYLRSTPQAMTTSTPRHRPYRPAAAAALLLRERHADVAALGFIESDSVSTTDFVRSITDLFPKEDFLGGYVDPYVVAAFAELVDPQNSGVVTKEDFAWRVRSVLPSHQDVDEEKEFVDREEPRPEATPQPTTTTPEREPLRETLASSDASTLRSAMDEAIRNDDQDMIALLNAVAWSSKHLAKTKNVDEMDELTVTCLRVAEALDAPLVDARGEPYTLLSDVDVRLRHADGWLRIAAALHEIRAEDAARRAVVALFVVAFLTERVTRARLRESNDVTEVLCPSHIANEFLNDLSRPDREAHVDEVVSSLSSARKPLTKSVLRVENASAVRFVVECVSTVPDFAFIDVLEAWTKSTETQRATALWFLSSEAIGRILGAAVGETSPSPFDGHEEMSRVIAAISGRTLGWVKEETDDEYVLSTIEPYPLREDKGSLPAAPTRVPPTAFELVDEIDADSVASELESDAPESFSVVDRDPTSTTAEEVDVLEDMMAQLSVEAAWTSYDLKPPAQRETENGDLVRATELYETVAHDRNEVVKAQRRQSSLGSTLDDSDTLRASNMGLEETEGLVDDIQRLLESLEKPSETTSAELDLAKLNATILEDESEVHFPVKDLDTGEYLDVSRIEPPSPVILRPHQHDESLKGIGGTNDSDLL